jgi:hypothetical protein
MTMAAGAMNAAATHVSGHGLVRGRGMRARTGASTVSLPRSRVRGTRGFRAPGSRGSYFCRSGSFAATPFRASSGVTLPWSASWIATWRAFESFV